MDLDVESLRTLFAVLDHGGMTPAAQRLDLSQSAASRHLKQLSATGYLIERRCSGAKCYSLNRERVQDTMRAVEAFLLCD